MSYAAASSVLGYLRYFDYKVVGGRSYENVSAFCQNVSSTPISELMKLWAAHFSLCEAERHSHTHFTFAHKIYAKILYLIEQVERREAQGGASSFDFSRVSDSFYKMVSTVKNRDKNHGFPSQKQITDLNVDYYAKTRLDSFLAKVTNPLREAQGDVLAELGLSSAGISHQHEEIKPSCNVGGFNFSAPPSDAEFTASCLSWYSHSPSLACDESSVRQLVGEDSSPMGRALVKTVFSSESGESMKPIDVHPFSTPYRKGVRFFAGLKGECSALIEEEAALVAEQEKEAALVAAREAFDNKLFWSVGVIVGVAVVGALYACYKQERQRQERERQRERQREWQEKVLQERRRQGDGQQVQGFMDKEPVLFSPEDLAGSLTFCEGEYEGEVQDNLSLQPLKEAERAYYHPGANPGKPPTFVASLENWQDIYFRRDPVNPESRCNFHYMNKKVRLSEITELAYFIVPPKSALLFARGKPNAWKQLGKECSYEAAALASRKKAADSGHDNATIESVGAAASAATVRSRR